MDEFALSGRHRPLNGADRVRRDVTPTERGAAYPLGAYGSSLRGIWDVPCMQVWTGYRRWSAVGWRVVASVSSGIGCDGLSGFIGPSGLATRAHRMPRVAKSADAGCLRRLSRPARGSMTTPSASTAQAVVATTDRNPTTTTRCRSPSLWTMHKRKGS